MAPSARFRMKIYTRRGDAGETGLLYGGRVKKTHPRTEAYGTVDEAVSALGFARAHSQDERVRQIVKRVQTELFVVASELATDDAYYDRLLKHFKPVAPDMVTQLERYIDELTAQVEMPRAFIVPGASVASAALDVARAVIRRAERKTVALQEAGMLRNPEVLRYVNRLADLLFVLARYEDRRLPQELLTGDG
ncbi:MAG: cob(I)yrinic acid a,c-diamide adenosyltransferase [Chloroflexi bacterium]|nr:cob(I)yrinic acid a,c-diamide adenosyltransferase [Chloroflexota bacterium]